MRLLVTSEEHFFGTPCGAVWTLGAWSTEDFWRPYLRRFDSVGVVARVTAVDQPPMGARNAQPPGVGVLRLPDFSGALGYLRTRPALLRAIRELPLQEAAVLLRAPSIIAPLLVDRLVRSCQPFGVSVLGDPFEVFAPEVFRGHLLRIPLRWCAWWTLRRICRLAAAVRYVNATALRRRYPPGMGAYVTSFSDVQLPPVAYAAPRATPRRSATTRLLFVGSMAQLYKGPDVLLRACARCVRDGLELHLTLLGDGRYRRELEDMATRLLPGRFCFRGEVPAGTEVRRELDSADLFVLPSLTEGLPRAMLEAMARGLPCIGTAVGGIPDLLEPEDLVPPADVAALSLKLKAVTSSPERMAAMSARNFDKAQDYELSKLEVKLSQFLDRISAATAERSGGRPSRGE